MELKAFMAALPGDIAKNEFAESCGTTLGHLRNCISQKKPLNPAVCVAVWRRSGGLVTRQELRADWADIWPELDLGSTRKAKAEAV